jgi:predicted PhzF superfamily epimerase YddE/YHI9
MTIPYYEVLAFTDRLFAGNPAGICLLNEKWLPDALMQEIAAENNLAETAFLIERADHFDLRWMTPAVEVDLCGHATLASGHVLFHHIGYQGDSIRFQSKSGEFNVRRAGERLVLDFPVQSLVSCATPPRLVEGLRAEPETVLKGRDYFAVFRSEAEVAAVAPDFKVVSELDAQGVIVTGPGDRVDFVSRYFAPAAGIPEDPVTGSTHCALIPYWAKRLGKKELRARQISPRGGDLFCEDRGERVNIGGQALTYSEGKLHIAIS